MQPTAFTAYVVIIVIVLMGDTFKTFIITFFTAEFANGIYKPMNTIFTILRNPVLFIGVFMVQVDDVNKIFCLLDLFHGSNAAITVVDLLNRLFLLLNCLNRIFGLGFLGLLGAAQILDAEDDFHNNRFGAPAVFIGVG